MKFVITIDTEADNQWTPVRGHLPVENLGVLPRFQALAERYGFPPTYLCTYEVAVADAFDRILRPLHAHGRAEVGAHLHPWSTPPVTAQDLTERGAAYPSELSAEVFTQKIECLTTCIADRLGAPPTSYRAGRWGFSAAHIADLVRLGYVADCSVTPLVRWNDRGAVGSGPDFRHAPAHPYFLDANDATREGTTTLVEVPMTIVYTNAVVRAWPVLDQMRLRYRKTRVARLVDGAFDVSPQWLRPYPRMTFERLRRVVDTARAAGLPVVELMFHSSELLPGGSPYNTTPADVDRVFDRLDRLFAYLRSLGVEGATLSAFARSMRRRA